MIASQSRSGAMENLQLVVMHFSEPAGPAKISLMWEVKIREDFNQEKHNDN